MSNVQYIVILTIWYCHKCGILICSWIKNSILFFLSQTFKPEFIDVDDILATYWWHRHQRQWSRIFFYFSEILCQRKSDSEWLIPFLIKTSDFTEILSQWFYPEKKTRFLSDRIILFKKTFRKNIRERVEECRNGRVPK